MTPPDYLSPYAKKIWPEVLAELDRRGRRLLVTRSQIEMFCQCLSQYRDITIKINKEGQLLEDSKMTAYGEHTTLKVHPAFDVQENLVRRAERLIKGLGLNEPLEEETSSAAGRLHHWLERARRSGETGERN